jgi:hypothetical protein
MVTFNIFTIFRIQILQNRGNLVTISSKMPPSISSVSIIMRFYKSTEKFCKTKNGETKTKKVSYKGNVNNFFHLGSYDINCREHDLYNNEIFCCVHQTTFQINILDVSLCVFISLFLNNVQHI